MSDVNVELGYSSTATVSLNDAAVRTLFAIASGQISLDDGHGKSNLNAYLTARSPYSSTVGGSSIARMELNTDGVAYYTDYLGFGDNNLHSISGQWKLSGASSSFEARMSVVSGTIAGATTGSWLSLSTTRQWTCVKSSGTGSNFAVGTLEIRMAASPFTVFATATISFEAERA